MSSITVYLAGPDVFKKDPFAVAEAKKAAFAGKEIVVLYPLDNDIKPFEPNKATADKIYQANVEMVGKCNVVVANMTPFRGPSIDPGTLVELVRAAMLGKLVIGYYEGERVPYIQRVINHYEGRVQRNGDHIQAVADGTTIENFGEQEIDNLMVERTILETGGQIFSSFQEAVDNVQMLWFKKCGAEEVQPIAL